MMRGKKNIIAAAPGKPLATIPKDKMSRGKPNSGTATKIKRKNTNREHKSPKPSGSNTPPKRSVVFRMTAVSAASSNIMA